jgi:hypothetical protein
MARLSLWKDGKHSNDYKFFDRRVSEMFTVGGTGILLHKYLGTNPQGSYSTTALAQTAPDIAVQLSSISGVNIGDTVSGIGVAANTKVTAISGNVITLNQSTISAIAAGTKLGFSGSASTPAYTNQSALNIQDLLWTENRDRKYDPDVYKMRGIYQRNDSDFDLTQFGLFLQTGTLFMFFHLRDMVDLIGRKIMAGDVLEIEHLKDYDSLNQDVPAALKRFYVVSDCNWPSEGFSPTWWPHLWKAKINPLVDSQEYKDILNNIAAGPDTTTPLSQIVSNYQTYLNINASLVADAEGTVPLSGYNTADMYTLATTEDEETPLPKPITIDALTLTADNGDITADAGVSSPLNKVQGYLTQDGRAPNQLSTPSGITFPTNPGQGDYFLRLDYIPSRLFRFDGQFWRFIEDKLRTNITPGAADNLTMRMSYVNNTNTYTDSNGVVHNEKQYINDALTPRADNE